MAGANRQTDIRRLVEGKKGGMQKVEKCMSTQSQSHAHDGKGREGRRRHTWSYFLRSISEFEATLKSASVVVG